MGRLQAPDDTPRPKNRTLKGADKNWPLGHPAFGAQGTSDFSPGGLHFSKAKSAALRLLKFRVRSEKEIRDKLKDKGYGAATIDEVAGFLTRAGLIDDALFARLWVESRLKRPFGMRRLRFELKNRGIDKKIAEDILEKARASTDEKAVIQDLVKNRLKRMRNLPGAKAKARLFGYLTRRGFSADVILEVLGEEI